MAFILPTDNSDSDRHVLGLLTSLEVDGTRSQRRIAAELGIALGLVNAYLKRAIKKGFVKVGQAPTRRYAYYLTPQGFSEKSRLTVQFLTSSFSLFRRAKDEYGIIFDRAQALGFRRIVLAGQSDLCEIALLCAVDRPVLIAAILDPDATLDRFVGVKLISSYDLVDEPFDAVVVTHLTAAKQVFDEAVSRFGEERVLVPDLLGLRPRQQQGKV